MDTTQVAIEAWAVGFGLPFIATASAVVISAVVSLLSKVNKSVE